MPSDWNECRYCGKRFPSGSVTACAVHEVYNCPERPPADQATLEEGWE